MSGFVQTQIEQNFRGSFFQAAQKVVPTLYTFGHGIGLAAALASMPVTTQEINELLESANSAVVAGYCQGFTGKVFVRSAESNNRREFKRIP